jgi:hypothetical protein
MTDGNVAVSFRAACSRATGKRGRVRYMFSVAGGSPGGELMSIFGWKEVKPPESKPDFSNVRSGGSSTASAAPQPTDTIGSGKAYVVVEGDSLSKIARREYGDASKWPTIYEANKEVITDPDLIFPGQELQIPGA